MQYKFGTEVHNVNLAPCRRAIVDGRPHRLYLSVDVSFRRQIKPEKFEAGCPVTTTPTSTRVGRAAKSADLERRALEVSRLGTI